MKTSELIGRPLDWAAHIALGLSEEEFVVVDNLYGPQWHGPEYSTDWQWGGPIIEREGMQIQTFMDKWLASIPKPFVQQDGATPLIAAMRCFVASRLGESVDIPEELV